MAVKIRLKRMGSNKKPFYRIVVADSRAPRDGRFIEEIGYYNPVSEPKQIKINDERNIHPYKQYENTHLWELINSAIDDLTTNQDIELTTRKEHVIGYLCKVINSDLNEDYAN